MRFTTPLLHIEILERRVLLAFDLFAEVVSSPEELVLANANREGLYGFGVVITNVGTTPFEGTVPLKVIFSTDAILGNADDITGATVVNDFTGGINFDDAVSHSSNIVWHGALTPGGDYYLGVVLDPGHTLADANRANDSGV